MSLNWNIEECADRPAITNDAEWPITETLIFATIPVGISRIEEGNVEEFHRRMLAVLDKPGEAWMRCGDGTGYNPSADDIRKRVGLWTNASRMTQTQFIANRKRIAAENEERRVRSILRGDPR